MTRRSILLLSLAACLYADSEKEVRDLLASAISGLSDGKPEGFLDAFNRSMPGMEKLRQWIVTLLNLANVSCSIEVLSGEGDEQSYTLVLDWIVRLDYKDERPGFTRRQKTVTCKFRKNAKKWQIVSFDPLELFAPPEG